MKALVRPKKLTSAVCCRLSEAQAARVAEVAKAAGLTTSEWSRQAILNTLDCPAWARLALAEFLALRSVVVDLQHDLIHNVKPSAERIRAILETADARKMAMADGRLHALAANSGSLA